MSLIFSSIVLGGYLSVLSRSGAEPSGDPKFEDNGIGEPGNEVCSASSNVRSLSTKTKVTHKNRESLVADTSNRRSKENL